MKPTKQSADFRQLTVEELDGRDLPSATLPNAAGLVSESVIVQYLDSPAKPAFASDITALGFGYYRVDLNPGVDQAAALQYFAAEPDVAAAMPDQVLTVESTPNDPSLSQQWSLTDTNTLAAWNTFTGTGQTIVAVIDTGIDVTHPDIAANMWVNPTENKDGYTGDLNGYNFVANDGDVMDDNGHGTHVAGIIGAVGNNGIGISGVDPHAKIMALKFLDASGNGYTSNAILALNFAVDHGAKIVNMSWGGGAYDAALAGAISAARADGVIIVTAAGNNGANNNVTPFYPASYANTFDNVVVVGASTSSNTPASYSDYGSTTVTVFAPGSSIYSLKPDDSYQTLSGTSMAAPFVTGALELLWDEHPTWTYSQIIGKLRASVDVYAAFNGKDQTDGVIDVAKLIGASTSPPVVVVPKSPPVTVSPPAVPPAATAPVSSRIGYASKSAVATISHSATATMTVAIAGNVLISDIDIGLNITDASDSGLVIKLIGPDGTSVLLANGLSGSNFDTTLFNDQAAKAVTASPAPYSGSLKPQGALAAFNGKNAIGTWTLSVTDSVAGNTGKLTSFTLYITGTAMTTQQSVANTLQSFASPPPAIVAWDRPAPAVYATPSVASKLRPETRAIMGYDLPLPSKAIAFDDAIMFHSTSVNVPSFEDAIASSAFSA